MHEPMEPISQTGAETLACRLTRSLTRRFGLILMAVAVLLIVDQAIIQRKLARLSIYAPQINVAGRQRMLSQKLVKSALASHLSSDEPARLSNLAELGAALDLWRKSHDGLLRGDASLGLPPTTSVEIRQAFAQLDRHYLEMVEAAEKLIARDTGEAPLATLMEHERDYLPQMDQIVGMYETDAHAQATTLRLLGLAAAASVIALMIALGRLVLLPATQTIRQQVASLEERVHDRTADLTLLNQTLQQEILIRQQAEERTRELANQLAHTSRMLSLGQLAAGIAHEINQPVAAIANYAATCSLTLESGTVDLPRLKQSINNILSTAHRTGDIVRSMRNFLRPGELQMTDSTMGALIADVVLICQPELQHNGVTLELDLDEKSSIIHVEPTQIQQVLVNLLQNAIQAQLEFPPYERRIQIRAHREGEELITEVVDAGPGFGETSPERVFDPFFTTKASGLGLGLAIARSIIHDHGGRLWAENRERGAAVSFILPLDSKHVPVSTAELNCVHR
jgi:two-component system, LuxR family, sensor kinase FixL